MLLVLPSADGACGSLCPWLKAGGRWREAALPRGLWSGGGEQGGCSLDPEGGVEERGDVPGGAESAVGRRWPSS